MKAIANKPFPAYRFIGGLRISSVLYCDRIHKHPNTETYPVTHQGVTAMVETCQLCGGTRLKQVA